MSSIVFESVTKRFPDGTVAVDELDLEVPEGKATVLVGPSGSGKTTTLRMINRMIEPSEGRILVGGQDVLAADPATLRRGIGYVIQQVGLFPHRTIADNVATVPDLLGWDRERTRRRVGELLELVGLSADLAGRYPHQLSGGQQQRVGVARALAADPPVLLMDEPFGAVDPIVRTELQDEFLRLQRELHKTIVFVTHDVDEAIKMGDRIAVFRQGGRLAQYDAPERLLAQPVDAFVADFLGPNRELKRLALIPVSRLPLRAAPVVLPDDASGHARRVAGEHGTDWVLVGGPEGAVLGWLALDRLDSQARIGDLPAMAFPRLLRPEDSLLAAVNAIVTSPLRVAVVVDAGCPARFVTLEELPVAEAT